MRLEFRHVSNALIAFLCDKGAFLVRQEALQMATQVDLYFGPFEDPNSIKLIRLRLSALPFLALHAFSSIGVSNALTQRVAVPTTCVAAN